MAHAEPMDWGVVERAGKEGRLMDVLVKLPRARWTERGPDGNTLFHYACCGANVAAVVALLQSGLLDVNVRNLWKNTPAYYAALSKQARVLEVLCAEGADLRACDGLINFALKTDYDTVRALVANGVRLSTVRERFRQYITPALVTFERGVLRCRAAAVAMLRVKRAGRLVHWDKFLLLELAVCIWCTRCAKEWQK